MSVQRANDLSHQPVRAATLPREGGSSEQPVDPDVRRALSVLAWADEIGTANPGLLESPPPRPTPAEWRAIPVGDMRRHMDSLLVGRYADEALEGLQRQGFFAAWLPEVDTMVGFGDGEWRHKDVWKHTKQVVRQAVPRLTVRWGALLHDVGKPKTRRIEPNGDVHFFGHSEVGAAMYRKRIAKRFAFEGELNDRIHYLILYHLRASQYDPSWTDAAVRRFTREMGDGLRDLLDLSRADITTKRPERRRRGLHQISELAKRIRVIAEIDARVPPLPKGLGNLLMQRFELPPSRLLGDMRDQLEHLCQDGTLAAGQSPEYYADYIADRRAEFGLPTVD